MNIHPILQAQIKDLKIDVSDNNSPISQLILAVSKTYDALELQKKKTIPKTQKANPSEIHAHLIEEILTISKGIQKKGDGELEELDYNPLLEELKTIINNKSQLKQNFDRNISRVNSLIENLQIGVLVENENREVVLTNAAFCDIFHIPILPQMLVGSDCTQAAEESKHLFNDPEIFIQRVNHILAKSEIVRGDVLELADGRVLERDFIPVHIDSEYRGHLWQYTDITHRIHSQTKIIQSEERLRKIMNSALDAIVAVNNNGQILSWNARSVDIFGWTEEEAIGKNLNETIIPSQHRAGHSAGMNHYNLTGHGPALNKLLELSAMHKSGIEFPVELSITPIKIGEEEFFVSFIRDISERKKAELNLAKSEEKYRNIIANMNLGLIEVDKHELIQYANQSFCEMSGYEYDEIVGKSAEQLFVVEENRQIVKTKRNLREDGVSDAYEIAVKNKLGELKWWLISGAPRYDEKGKQIGSIGIHLDVTAQKQIANELLVAKTAAEQSSVAKETFLANMSHEIRTPLNGIIGFIRQLSKEKLNESQQYYVESIGKASKHLHSIINNILDLSKIDAGELKLESYPFQLKEVLIDIKRILDLQAIEKGIPLHLEIDQDIAPQLLGDATRIRQILLNVAGNAIKFTEKGYVQITCKRLNEENDEQLIQLIVKDTGMGIDKKFMTQIFTKFQQEDLSSSRKYGGTGLGLVICKQIIDLMDGTIEIKSKKGQGTEIEIRLKLPISHSEITTIGSSPSLSAIPAGIKILLVEDNAMNRVVVINSLQSYEVQITEAVNGAEALEYMKKDSFDLILMDLQMPVMGGIEAAVIIRKELKNDVPIIVLTANAFKNEIANCIALGMNDYLTKPFEEEDLIRVIQKNLKLKETPIPKQAPNKVPADDNVELYSLLDLRKMGHGNEAFIIKMLQLFVEIATISVQEMNQAFQDRDFIKIQSIAHKVKPSILNLRIHSIKDDVDQLEMCNTEIIEETNLKKIIDRVNDVLTKVCEQIQKQN